MGIVGEDPNGEPIILFEIDKSAGKDVPMRILEQFKGIVGSDSDGSWNLGTAHQKCLLHYFRDMYRTTKENKGSEFSLLFMDVQHPQGRHRHRRARIRRGRGGPQIPDTPPPVQRVRGQGLGGTKREGDSLFTFIMHDVEYHNNASERAEEVSAFRKILYGNRYGRRQANQDPHGVYATCELPSSCRTTCQAGPRQRAAPIQTQPFDNI